MKFKHYAIFKLKIGDVELVIGMKGPKEDVELMMKIYKPFIEKLYGSNYELILG